MGKSIHERWKEDAYYYEKRAAEDESSRERAKKKMEQIKANLKVNQDKIKQMEERLSKKNR
ncbi:hypothetical protein [Mammaliicoccus sciuri]|uniref:hypothetical protein n=1 Tax=Mammaliicoccus sciuri TaxID=1296 RepID=UPI001E488BA0|nr:hypothetical protein [Mammaliicoccus sciuri]MCD8795974.1 hypothetical protein [Mammaliicoccus sciuri]